MLLCGGYYLPVEIFFVSDENSQWVKCGTHDKHYYMIENIPAIHYACTPDIRFLCFSVTVVFSTPTWTAIGSLMAHPGVTGSGTYIVQYNRCLVRRAELRIMVGHNSVVF